MAGWSPEIEELVLQWSAMRPALQKTAEQFLGKDADLDELGQGVLLDLLEGRSRWDRAKQPHLDRFVFGLMKGRYLNQRRSARAFTATSEIGWRSSSTQRSSS